MAPHNRFDEDHVVPPALPYDVLRGLVLNRDPFAEAEIRAYVESQSPGEQVQHLERVATEHVNGHRYDVWDVALPSGRWWVITAPTNLYPQEYFPSLDYTLSLHIGVTARVLARDRTGATAEERSRLLGAFRRWEQAAEALDSADEAEHFQAIGNHCRMALLEMRTALADPEMVPAGTEPPKADQFPGWTDLIAEAITAGGGTERVRAYLKGIARDTWQLASWLTHAKNATPFDAHIVVDATLNTLEAFSTAAIRHELGPPRRCGQCGSYRVRDVARPEIDGRRGRALLCEKCGAFAVLRRRPRQNPEPPAPSLN